MRKQGLIISKIMIVFFVCSAFLKADDTIIKGKIVNTGVTPVKTIGNKTPVVDSIFTLAVDDVTKYNASVEAKDASNRKILESNKQMLEYEKQENKLIKEVILKFKQGIKEETKELEATIDSVCVKYKTPLFGKKKCIEYSPIYTIVKDGKEIKLKEIK